MKVIIVEDESLIAKGLQRTLKQVDNTVEVLSGLALGDQVVIAGQSALKDDALVNVVTVREF